MREKLSENFYRDEFACRCGCGFDTVDIALVQYAQQIRTHFDRAVTIISGCRCPHHNAGTPDAADASSHMVARAADLVVESVPAYLVQEYAEQIAVPGIGKYENSTHIDSRSGSIARW